MRVIAYLLACWACPSHGRRVHVRSSRVQGSTYSLFELEQPTSDVGVARSRQAFAKLLTAHNDPAAPWQAARRGRGSAVPASGLSQKLLPSAAIGNFKGLDQTPLGTNGLESSKMLVKVLHRIRGGVTEARENQSTPEYSNSVVVGIDLGSLNSLVAYVGRGSVDVVQNEVSRRTTPSIVGFTERQRLLGDAALSQVRFNANSTCRMFKLLLGRDDVSASDLAKEHFWSTSGLCTEDDSSVCYEVTFKGKRRLFDAVQITAMFLSKLKEITEQWCQAYVQDAVISVPSYFSDVHRQALLDAAKIAGISVLCLMNEHTATALAYGFFNSNNFKPDKVKTVAFCSMGHSTFSVSIVQFVEGRFRVVYERSVKVGGRDMDECLMREFAARFQRQHGLDPLSSKRALFKLEEAVAKTKKILSANSEANINVECLRDDLDFSSSITRADFERLCQPVMNRVKAVLAAVKATSRIPNEQIDSVEIVGGACRVPWFKQICSEAFGKPLSTQMNADESVARGCALQAAMLSPRYKVKDFKAQDASTCGVCLMWKGAVAHVDKREAAQEEEGDVWVVGGVDDYATAIVFPAGSTIGGIRMLTFFAKDSFEVHAKYADDAVLLPGTKKELSTYKIEMPSSDTNQKVKVKAKLTMDGIFILDGAQLVEEEEYEYIAKEERELPAGGTPTTAEPAAGDASTSKEPTSPNSEQVESHPKEPEKEVQWVDVVKTEKRMKYIDLTISVTGAPGLAAEELQNRIDEESRIQSETLDILETLETRNDLETYIFEFRDHVQESGRYGSFISAPERKKFLADLLKAEDWLYDNEGATKAQYVEKLQRLKAIGDTIAFRYMEDSNRLRVVRAALEKITRYRSMAQEPGEDYGHIASGKLAQIVLSCDNLEKWILEKKARQERASKAEKPVFLCVDIEAKVQDFAKKADEILREPKPAPPKQEKREASAQETPKSGAAPQEVPAADATAGEDATAQGS